MSFILDALKKSEIERQRQAIPGLMDSPAPASRARFPLWAVALGALLGINLLVLAIVLTRGAAPAFLGGRAVDSPAKPRQAPAPVPVPDHFSPLDAAPVYAPEIPSDAGRLPSPVGSIAPRHTARMPDPVLTQDDDKSDYEVLPSISEINLAGQQALPELHIDVHVYATKPAERFVYINMHKYREGSTLAEGPLLERIRRDGVVLNYRGLRFVLPRQQ